MNGAGQKWQHSWITFKFKQPMNVPWTSVENIVQGSFSYF